MILKLRHDWPDASQARRGNLETKKRPLRVAFTAAPLTQLSIQTPKGTGTDSEFAHFDRAPATKTRLCHSSHERGIYKRGRAAFARPLAPATRELPQSGHRSLLGALPTFILS